MIFLLKYFNGILKKIKGFSKLNHNNIIEEVKNENKQGNIKRIR